MPVRTVKILLFELGAPVALLVKVKVASVHACEVALAQHDRPFAHLASDILTHVKVTVATLAGFSQCGVAHRVPLVTLFGFRFGCLLFPLFDDYVLEETVDMIHCRTV